MLGGNGFIGREIVARLADRGHAVKVLTRATTPHRDLRVLPTVRIARADVHEPKTLAREFAGCDVVINLVGILNERRLGNGDREFRRAHTELPIKVVEACRVSGVRRYLHMSGLKADSQRGPSHYLRTKGAAEDYLRRECAAGRPECVIFQPSVVFGPHDAFVNQFAAILKITPGVLPLACADARFAPVYVGDVAEAFVRCLDRNDVAGRTFQLYGPETITLGDIVRLTARTLGLRRWVLPLPRGGGPAPGRDDGLRAGQAILDRQLPLRVGCLGRRARRARGTRHHAHAAARHDRDVSAEMKQPSPASAEQAGEAVSR